MTDNRKIIVLTADDHYIPLEDWQRQYGLEVGSVQIAKHFSYTEPKFAEDLKRYGKLIVCAPLMMVLDEYRELTGEATNINAFNRDDQKQKELKAAGFRTAEYSPHVEKMAADCDTLSVEDTLAKVVFMRQAGVNMGIPIRIGYNQYLNMKDENGKPAPMTFIHVDPCPLYYAKGRPRHGDPHPLAWERQIEW